MSYRRPLYLLCGWILVGFLTTDTLAQENFVAGTIFRGSSQESGLIDYRSWRKNPDKIVFKPSASAEAVILTPLDITAFLVEGDRYVSALTETDVSVLQGGIAVGPPQYAADTIFLLALIQGEKSLFQYLGDSDFPRYYIESEPSVYSILAYHKYEELIRGYRKVFEINRFRPQLASYLQDCPELVLGRRSVRYSEKDLRRVFKRYYACKGIEPEYEAEALRLGWAFGIVSGVQIASIRGAGLPLLESTEWTPSVDFAGGLFVETFLPRNRQKWALYNEFSLSSYTFAGEWVESEEPYQTKIHTSSISISYARLNTMVRFRYPLPRMRIFVNGGVTNGLILRQTSYQRVRTTTTTTHTERERPFLLEAMRSHEQSLVIGGGVLLKGISMEARLERSNGFSPYTHIGTKISRYSFLVGYRF